VERVRARLAPVLGEELTSLIPRRYTRLGRVLVVRLPERLRPFYPVIGEAYAEEVGVAAVLRPAGPIEGEFRRPRVELIHGSDARTEVTEHGARWRFDAQEVMFARGNKEERARVGRLVEPGERVVDLFAGIGYFVIPMALRDPGIHLVAAEANPVAFRFLIENLHLNGVSEQVEAHRGDNRELPLPRAWADRVLLGYLPSSLPWIDLALELLRPEGGTLHVHLIVGSRPGPPEAASQVGDALKLRDVGWESLRGRAVKPYGPGRIHAVVDAEILPRSPDRAASPRQDPLPRFVRSRTDGFNGP
jgi:tRNA wybutosine-synthesizing protein 2